MKKDNPEIVASQSFLDQTQAFSAVSIFTPTMDGIFRVSVYCDFSPSVINGNFVPFSVPVFISDDFGQLEIVPTAIADNGPENHGATGFVWLVKLKAGQPVVLGPGGAPSAGITYNLYITVEDLN